MPRKFKRSCDWCGKKYHGEGRKFCSQRCDVERRRAESDAKEAGFATEPDERIRTNETGDGISVYVPASEQITTHEELLDKAEIDLDEWTVRRVPLRTWTVPMKINEEPHVIQLHYVGVELVPHVSNSWDLKPLEIIVQPPKTRPAKRRAGFVSVHYGDVHFPHQDDAALAILYDLLEELQPDLVVCHGDLLDCEQISRYPKDPFRRTSLAEEIQMGAEHLGRVRAIVPDADLWFLEGNHEERLKRMVWKMADDRSVGELITLDAVRNALTWQNLLGLDSMGWEFTRYGDHRLLLNKLVCCHGSFVRKHSGASARAQHDAFRKGGISGHTHRMGTYYHTGYDGSVQAWFEIGLLGKVRSDYMDRPPNWAQGLIIVCADESGHYGVEHVGIHDGRAIFRGKSYGH